jgi:hypothetical protein
MNPDPRSIRKRLSDLGKEQGDFCSPVYVSPFDLKQLQNILFKKPDMRSLFGPVSAQETTDEEQDK